MIEGCATPDAAVNELFGPTISIVTIRAVGGGCINRTSVVEVSDGRRLFLKENGRDFPGMFRVEAEGLNALRAAGDGSPCVPEPLAWNEGKSGQYLLMEHISGGGARTGGSFWRRFGRELAGLHRASPVDFFGFPHDNYIGSTPQPNTKETSWIAFFAHHRLQYQMELAARNGRADAALRRQMDRLITRLPDLLVEPDKPSLVHGDLWGGNYMVGDKGEPVLIDPAVYYGHREVDIAMTELFGGFHRDFYASYNEAYPLQPGYTERRDLYNLYHVLNHLNLFGSSYEGSVRATLRRYAG